MQVFKDVIHPDIDMLLPGAEVKGVMGWFVGEGMRYLTHFVCLFQAKFTWLDYFVIWGSIAFAVGFASWKAANGTLQFDNFMNIGLALVRGQGPQSSKNKETVRHLPGSQAVLQLHSLVRCSPHGESPQPLPPLHRLLNSVCDGAFARCCAS